MSVSADELREAVANAPVGTSPQVVAAPKNFFADVNLQIQMVGGERKGFNRVRLVATSGIACTVKAEGDAAAASGRVFSLEMIGSRHRDRLGQPLWHSAADLIVHLRAEHAMLFDQIRRDQPNRFIHWGTGGHGPFVPIGDAEMPSLQANL